MQLTLAERPAATATRRTAPHIPGLRIEAEHVLVKVVLQVLLTHAVVCSRQPSLEIRKHPVHSWEEFGGVRPVPLGLTVVFIASVPKGTVAAPAICMHDASGGHRLLDEAHQRRGR